MLSWITLVFLAFVVVLMAFDSVHRSGLYTVPVWAAALMIGYYASRRWNPRHNDYLALSQSIPTNDTNSIPIAHPKWIARQSRSTK